MTQAHSDNSRDIPAGFYTQWNLPAHDVANCDVYELLRVTRPELELRIYKAFEQIKDSDGEFTQEFEFHIMHKGNMYHIVWQFESFQAYVLKSTWPSTTEFIISLRRCGEYAVALVQRRRDKRTA